MRQINGKFGGVYVDCTFGRGGHSREILSRLGSDAQLFAFDVDPEAVAVARQLEMEDPRFHIIHKPFASLCEVFEPGQLSGVLLDLGVSSPQLDDRHRGFSFREDGPLDMRMNQEGYAPTASEWLQNVVPEELAWVIYSYGEDDDPILAERIAETILSRQQEHGGAITTTRHLQEIIRHAKANMDDSGMPPAKLTFQAIRVFLNQEMQQLDRAMSGAFEKLAVGGRCCIIAFKKKEANAIRKFVREHEEPDYYLKTVVSRARLCELYPLLTTEKDFSVRQVAEPIRPAREELERNGRSRSSAVHVLQRAERKSPCSLAAAGVREACDRFWEPRLRPAFEGANECAALCNVQEEEDGGSVGAVCPDAAPPVSEDAAVASAAGGRSAACPQASAADVSAAAAHALARAQEEFLGRGPSGERVINGHLALRKGELVHVLYRGTEGDEAGWHYGRTPEGDEGWFPASSVAPAEPNHAG